MTVHPRGLSGWICGFVLSHRTGADRWPLFGPWREQWVIDPFILFPLRLREEIVGVLQYFGNDHMSDTTLPGPALQALAGAATIGIIHRREYASSSELNRQLQTALTTRILIEQAKGSVSARLGFSSTKHSSFCAALPAA